MSAQASGIFKNVPEKAYHMGEGLSQSSLKTLGFKSPLHYKHALTNPFEPTGATEFGSLLHCNVLQPEKLMQGIIRTPGCERRSKVDKATWEAFGKTVGDKIMVTPGEGAVVTQHSVTGKWTTHHEMTMDLSDTMKFAVYSNKIAMRALEKGGSEMSLYSEDDETGILKRCRIDRLPEGNAIVDIKTTEDGSPKGFAKAVANYGYHIQGAWYIDICNELGMEKENFVIVALEKKPPYAVSVYILSEAALNYGRKLYREWLRTLADCLEKDEWPGYQEKFVTLDLPNWA